MVLMVLAAQTTKSIDVLNNSMFCGDSGKRTIFQIALTQGQARDITRYSLISAEDEVLLPPGCRFRVEGLMDAGSGLTIIQLLELPSEEWIVDLSPGEKSSKALQITPSSDGDAQDAGGAIAAAPSTGDASLPPECCAFFSMRFGPDHGVQPMAGAADGAETQGDRGEDHQHDGGRRHRRGGVLPDRALRHLRRLRLRQVRSHLSGPNLPPS